MLTLIHKKNQVKTYELTCSIPLHKAEAKEVFVKDGKKGEKSVGHKKEGERVLTLLPFEHRKGLPDAVLLSPAIQTAIAKGEIAYKQHQVAKPEEKPVASSKKTEKETK